MPKAFPVEFRRDVVAVARKGEAPLSQIAKGFGIWESCLHRWLKLADIGEASRRASLLRSRRCCVSWGAATRCWTRKTRSSAGTNC